MVLLSIFSMQSSTLWSTITIVPLSIMSVFTSMSINSYSGILILIYITVFVGGLLILLISMASITFRESSVFLEKPWTLFIMVFLVPLLMEENETSDNSCSLISSILWFEYQAATVVGGLLILLISMASITKCLLVFKGLIRSI